MNEFPGYDKEHEQVMRVYFRSLPEDHRRRYAAVEAHKIGFGGISYISEVLGLSRGPIYEGLRELEQMVDSDDPQRPGGEGRIRRPGAGRPKESARQAGLEEAAKQSVGGALCGQPHRCAGEMDRSQADEILLTFDAGGANSVRSPRFREDLLNLSERLGLRLRIAHYPPYTSKWHPIEHRLFSQIERALRGIIPDSIETVRDAIQRTTTQTGLTVKTYILDKLYPLGRKCSEVFEDIKDRYILHHDFLGKWNYTVDAAGVK